MIRVRHMHVFLIPGEEYPPDPADNLPAEVQLNPRARPKFIPIFSEASYIYRTHSSVLVRRNAFRK